MPVSFPVNHDHAGARSDRSDPWGELRRYEQAKADGTAPEASFDDLLDVVNPLQHIPIVSTIYREITGDAIQGAARIVGGGLYGGVGGFVGGLVNAIAEEATGRDLGEHVMVAVGLSEDTPGDGTTPAEAVQVADADAAGRDGPAADTTGQPAAAAQLSADDAAANAGAPALAASTGTRNASAQARPAGDDAALAGGGALTGLAALKAFARDTGQAATAAHADRAQAAHAPADLQANQQARAAADSATGDAGTPTGPSENAGRAGSGDVPTSFMPLTDRNVLTNTRARTTAAAIAAEADPIGHRRLQGDPRAVPTPAHSADPSPAARAPSSPAEPASGVAPTPPNTTAPNPTPEAARGDLAERMMRALGKYEAMRREP